GYFGLNSGHIMNACLVAFMADHAVHGQVQTALIKVLVLLSRIHAIGFVAIHTGFTSKVLYMSVLTFSIMHIMASDATWSFGSCLLAMGSGCDTFYGVVVAFL